MLQKCINQNLFLYAMIAAGIAGVWCLFWTNRFYAKAIRDLRRMDHPKSKWTSAVLRSYEQRTDPLRNTGAFIRRKLDEGRVAGLPVTVLRRGVQRFALLAVCLLAVSLWGMYLYQYEASLWIRHGVVASAVAGGLMIAGTALDLQDKESILADGWLDYLENTARRAEKEPEQMKNAAGEAKDKPVSNRSAQKSEPTIIPAWASAPGDDAEARISQVREGIRQSAAADSRFAGLLSPEEESIMREVIREYLA